MFKKKRIEIKNETKSEFTQNKDYVLNYLKSRKVQDKNYLSILKNYDFAFLQDNTIIVYNEKYNQNDEYIVEYFLTCSNVAGRDIVESNKNLGLDSGDIIAIASVAGDDVICLNIQTNEILLYLVQTGDMQYINLANNFKEFLTKINF